MTELTDTDTCPAARIRSWHGPAADKAPLLAGMAAVAVYTMGELTRVRTKRDAHDAAPDHERNRVMLHGHLTRPP